MKKDIFHQIEIIEGTEDRYYKDNVFILVIQISK